jgi:hypothetical protein
MAAAPGADPMAAPRVAAFTAARLMAAAPVAAALVALAAASLYKLKKKLSTKTHGDTRPCFFVEQPIKIK